MLLVSCGSDSQITQNPQQPVSGIVRTGVAFGPISGFGSIIVNGVRYDTSSASFNVDDSSGVESDLKVGQIVYLKTETDDQGNSSATSVNYDDIVEGPISAIDFATNAFTVLGQLVMVDSNTSFDDSISPSGLEGLNVGDIVEVSGLFDSQQQIQATRVELKTASTEYEIHGTVSNLDASAQTFMLNDLLVDYSQASLDDFGSDTLSDGDLVEVKGINLGANDELIASKVELEDSIEDADDDDRIGDDGDSAEVEGYITDFTSSSQFSVAGIPVMTTSATVYEDGVSADLALDIKVEVEGEFNIDGILIADKIEFELEASTRIRAVIDSINSSNSSLTILGIEFVTDSSTRYEDQSDANIESFSFSNLSAGDYIELRAATKEGVLIAAQIERDDFEQVIELQGFVESIGTNNDLKILGITINTNAVTSYENIDETSMTQGEFFAALTVSNLVNAQGTTFSGNALLAEELEFELDD